MVCRPRRQEGAGLRGLGLVLGDALPELPDAGLLLRVDPRPAPVDGGAHPVLDLLEPGGELADALARHLLTSTDARDLEITSRSIEDAFLSLTGGPDDSEDDTNGRNPS